MEQFRHIGGVLGGLKALMVLQEDIQFNRHQCCLLLDMFGLAFSTIAEHIRQNLKLEEKNTKWKLLDHPLKELYGVFKDGEQYIKHCLDVKDWWGKAISLHHNNDCVEFHIHNLLSIFPAVIEAIENAGEISGLDPDEMLKRRLVLARKYDKEWNDTKLFQWKFGTEYLVPHHICKRLENAWREDKWNLIEAILKKKTLGSVVLTTNEQHLSDVLLNKLKEPCKKIYPSWILTEGKDYQVRRPLAGSDQYKEFQWLGESFAMRHFFADVSESLNSEISAHLNLSHPNILQYLCGFCEEERKEYLLVTELMSKDLAAHIRESSSPRKPLSFSISVVIDLMLQIARGMEYLHSQGICHGDLNPSNILLRPRSSNEGYFYAKIMGFGLSSVRNLASHDSTQQNANNPVIWYAPEVLSDQDEIGYDSGSNYTEKADVYSYGMICFQLLTGKQPFEDDHLQGDRISKNIRAGERPLFPSFSPKYLVSLTKRCWQADPALRPTFRSICRILRYIKKFRVLNPENGQPELLLPPLDYCDVEASLNKFLEEQNSDLPPVSQIPFEIFCYSLVEKEKAYLGFREKRWTWGSDVNSVSLSGDENAPSQEDPFSIVPAGDTRSVGSARHLTSDARSVYSENPIKKMASAKKLAESKPKRVPRLPRTTAGLPRTQSPRRSTLSPSARTLRTDRGSQLSPVFGGTRRPSSRHLQGSGKSKQSNMLA